MIFKILLDMATKIKNSHDDIPTNLFDFYDFS